MCCGDNLAYLLALSTDNGEPPAARVMSHMQEQEPLMSFCISFIYTGARRSVCVCDTVGLVCAWMCVIMCFYCIPVCVCVCSSRGAACCLSPYLEADLICCNTAAQDTLKSHDLAQEEPSAALILTVAFFFKQTETFHPLLSDCMESSHFYMLNIEYSVRFLQKKKKSTESKISEHQKAPSCFVKF